MRFRLVRRTGDGMPDEEDLREVHDVLEGAFVDHFNHFEETFEEFLHRLREDPGHRWDHWWLAELVDGDDVRPVGTLLGSVSESTSGPHGSYVEYLGVLEAARGRGVAKGLLSTIIADAAARGRDRVGLEVDADRPARPGSTTRWAGPPSTSPSPGTATSRSPTCRLFTRRRADPSFVHAQTRRPVCSRAHAPTCRFTRPGAVLREQATGRVCNPRAKLAVSIRERRSQGPVDAVRRQHPDEPGALLDRHHRLVLLEHGGQRLLQRGVHVDRCPRSPVRTPSRDSRWAGSIGVTASRRRPRVEPTKSATKSSAGLASSRVGCRTAPARPRPRTPPPGHPSGRPRRCRG